MAEQELNSYRLTSKEEPSLQMLSETMKKACCQANAKWEKAEKEFCDNFIKGISGIPHIERDTETPNSSEHQPYLIVIAGPNGSGKTTITSQFLNHQWLEDAVYINPDNVAQEKFGDWNSPEAVLKAARYCVELREECLSNHKNMVIETVLSTELNVSFILRAINEGYFVRLFFVATENPTINANRVARRVMEGGHDVPIPKIISRYPKSIFNCRRLANVVDRLYVVDNSVDGEQARLVFSKSHGKFMGQYVESLPLWAAGII